MQKGKLNAVMFGKILDANQRKSFGMGRRTWSS